MRRQSSRFKGTQAHLQTHPAVIGMNGEALRAWPVYGTFSDRGRRHIEDCPTYRSRGLSDCSEAAVRISSVPAKPNDNSDWPSWVPSSRSACVPTLQNKIRAAYVGAILMVSAPYGMLCDRA